MKLRSLIGVVALSLFAAAGCADETSSDTSPTTSPSPSPNPLPPGDAIVGDGEIAGQSGGNGEMAPSAGAGTGGSSASDTGGSTGGSATTGGTGTIQAGTLTAGAWDDNRNFEFFTDYRKKNASLPGAPSFTDAEYDAAHTSFANIGAAKTKLDVSLVIDTTGSMGDEITYLQKEFDALAQTISSRFPGSEQHWSLVLYKDTYDQYIVKWFDFRDSPTEFRTKLALAEASGGGDLPEAPDQALDIAYRLSWRQDASVAKLMFWVADAPHHDDNATKFAGAIRGAQSRGIHIYPVASSGVDGLAELSMRSAAQLTGGRYVFLTDDSGVGGAHLEPSVPCYFVTKLDQAILRMVDIEMSGQYREPTSAELVRTGGDPANGACKLSDGKQVTIY
jgi:hypothetical protein